MVHTQTYTHIDIHTPIGAGCTNRTRGHGCGVFSFWRRSASFVWP
ncbi:unnamed protein product, partial [Amoebophrya sp. A25]|eukprot:GSA25T00006015001.1